MSGSSDYQYAYCRVFLTPSALSGELTVKIRNIGDELFMCPECCVRSASALDIFFSVLSLMEYTIQFSQNIYRFLP